MKKLQIQNYNEWYSKAVICLAYKCIIVTSRGAYMTYCKQKMIASKVMQKLQ